MKNAPLKIVASRFDAIDRVAPPPPDPDTDALLAHLLLEELEVVAERSRLAATRGHTTPEDDQLGQELESVANDRMKRGVSMTEWDAFATDAEEAELRRIRLLRGAASPDDLRSLCAVFEACHARRAAGDVSRWQTEQNAAQLAANARRVLWSAQERGAPADQIEAAEAGVREAVEALSRTWEHDGPSSAFERGPI